MSRHLRLVAPLVILVTAALALPLAAATEPPRATLILSPDPVSVHGYLQITLTVVAPASAVDRPRLELQNLDLLHGPRRREHFSWVDGNLTESTSFVWLARPRSSAEPARVAVEATVDREPLELPVRSVRVAATRTRPSSDVVPDGPLGNLLRQLVPELPRRRVEPPRVLLEAAVDPVAPYRGEQTTYTLALLVERTAPRAGQLDVESIFPRRVPSFAGFWSEELPLSSLEDERPRISTIDGREYWRQPVLRRGLFAYEAGTHTIEAAEIELRASLSYTSARAREKVGRRTLRRESRPVTVRVRPLPDPPDGFDGAIGSFDLAARVEPGRIEVGETAVLSVSLAGRGEASALTPPGPIELRGVETLSPEPVVDHEVEDGLVHTRREWRYVLLPRRPGAWEIPPLELTYFDPARERYATSTTAAMTLQVRAPSAGSEGDEPGEIGAVADESPPSPGASLALVLGILLVVTAAGVGWRQVRTHRRRRRTLAAIATAMDELRPTRAAAEIERICRERLRERWPVAPSARCETWPRALAEHGADSRTVEVARDLAGEIGYLRRAPRLASTEAMREEIVRRCRALLRSL